MAVTINGTTGITTPDIDVSGTVTADELRTDVSATGGIKFEENDGSAGVKVTTYQGTTNDNVRGVDFHAQKFNVFTGAPQGTTTTQAFEIDNNANLKFNSGYGSAATAYGCRAWVNFKG